MCCCPSAKGKWGCVAAGTLVKWLLHLPRKTLEISHSYQHKVNKPLCTHTQTNTCKYNLSWYITGCRCCNPMLSFQKANTQTHTHSSFANMDKPYLAVLRKMHFRGKWHHYHINDFQPNTSANVATHTHTAVNVILVTHNFSASHTNKHTQSKNSALTSHTAFKNRLALLVLMAFNPTLMYGEKWLPTRCSKCSTNTDRWLLLTGCLLMWRDVYLWGQGWVKVYRLFKSSAPIHSQDFECKKIEAAQSGSDISTNNHFHWNVVFKLQQRSLFF